MIGAADFERFASLGVKEMGSSVISLYRGNDKKIHLEVKRIDGGEFNCSGATVTLYVKKDVNDEDEDAIIAIVGLVCNTNEVEFEITPSHTTSAKAKANLKDDKPYPYDIKVVTPDPDSKKYTCLRSQFVILGS